MTYIRQSTHKGAKVSCIDEDSNWDEAEDNPETDNSDELSDSESDERNYNIYDFYA